VHYQQGVEAYYDDDWLAAVQYIEQSLPEYFKEYERCLALCDYPYDDAAFTQLHQQIINSNVAKRDRLLLGMNICTVLPAVTSLFCCNYNNNNNKQIFIAPLCRLILVALVPVIN